VWSAVPLGISELQLYRYVVDGYVAQVCEVVNIRRVESCCIGIRDLARRDHRRHQVIYHHHHHYRKLTEKIGPPHITHPTPYENLWKNEQANQVLKLTKSPYAPRYRRECRLSLKEYFAFYETRRCQTWGLNSSGLGVQPKLRLVLRGSRCQVGNTGTRRVSFALLQLCVVPLWLMILQIHAVVPRWLMRLLPLRPLARLFCTGWHHTGGIPAMTKLWAPSLYMLCIHIIDCS
jgi:hypothetical protein